MSSDVYSLLSWQKLLWSCIPKFHLPPIVSMYLNIPFLLISMRFPFMYYFEHLISSMLFIYPNYFLLAYVSIACLLIFLMPFFLYADNILYP